jgi:hypothetical protein
MYTDQSLLHCIYTDQSLLHCIYTDQSLLHCIYTDQSLLYCIYTDHSLLHCIYTDQSLLGHLCWYPTEMESNCRSGAVVCPWWPWPQQDSPFPSPALKVCGVCWEEWGGLDWGVGGGRRGGKTARRRLLVSSISVSISLSLLNTPLSPPSIRLFSHPLSPLYQPTLPPPLPPAALLNSSYQNRAGKLMPCADLLEGTRQELNLGGERVGKSAHKEGEGGEE